MLSVSITVHIVLQQCFNSNDPNPDVRHFMSLLPETYMTALRNLHLEDKVS
jgi:hypothetical protein